MTKLAAAPALGVIAGEGLYCVNPEVPAPVLMWPGVPRSFEPAANLAHDLGLAQLWVHRSALERAGLPLNLEPHMADQPHRWLDERGPWRLSGSGLRPWLSAWIAGESDYFELGVPSWDAGGNPFASCETGEQLALELWAYTASGAPLWHRNGGITSDAWLRAHWRGKLRPAVMPEVYAPDLELPLTWHRSVLSPGEDKARSCYSFDVNGAYLSAASSLALPVGGAQHVATGSRFDPGLPGLWRCSRPLWRRYSSLPAPWPPGEGDCWLTTPGAVLACEQGAQVREGWAWREHHRYLEPWYRVLREARSALLYADRPVALEAVKSIYKRGVGRLGSTVRARGAEDALYQPYWRLAVIAEARARYWRRLAGLKTAPVAVDPDCAYFLSSARRPDTFARAAGIPLEEGLGKFKPAGAMPGRAAREVLGEEYTPRVIRQLWELKA